MIVFSVMYLLFIYLHGKQLSGESKWTDIRDAVICSALSWFGVIIITFFTIILFFIKDKKYFKIKR